MSQTPGSQRPHPTGPRDGGQAGNAPDEFEANMPSLPDAVDDDGRREDENGAPRGGLTPRDRRSSYSGGRTGNT